MTVHWNFEKYNKNLQICRLFYFSFSFNFPCNLTRFRPGDFDIIFIKVFKGRHKLYAVSGSALQEKLWVRLWYDEWLGMWKEGIVAPQTVLSLSQLLP